MIYLSGQELQPANFCRGFAFAGFAFLAGSFAHINNEGQNAANANHNKIKTAVSTEQFLSLINYMGNYRVDCFISEPAAVYRAKRAQYLTSHQLLDYAHCPALY
jgi:hypothetical protein